jgi:hypothetical protein
MFITRRYRKLLVDTGAAKRDASVRQLQPSAVLTSHGFQSEALPNFAL